MMKKGKGKMQLNKVLKGLLIALPIIAMTACSSNKNAADSSSNETSTDQTQSQPVSNDTGSTTSDSGTVVSSPVSGVDTMSETELQDKIQQENTVFFGFDKSVISSDYKDMLAAHALYLSRHPNVKVTVEGHTDERGTPEYNIALGERRAVAVSKYLQALGVQSSQISIVSYGEEKPLVRGHNEAAYAKNRRAVIVY